jgi:hypothetical protein
VLIVIDDRRLRSEISALNQYGLGHFTIQSPRDPEKCGALGTIDTNTGAQYTIWMPLKYFPDDVPPIYIVAPLDLEHFNGKLLKNVGVVRNMHLNQPSPHGHPNICHHSPRHWRPSFTVARTLIKARLWLEAYESHLQSGKLIDYYLGHMDG